MHEAAPKGYFNDVVVLDGKAMWRSLFLQCWDDYTERYATFDEVLSRHAAAKAA